MDGLLKSTMQPRELQRARQQYGMRGSTWASSPVEALTELLHTPNYLSCSSGLTEGDHATLVLKAGERPSSVVGPYGKTPLREQYFDAIIAKVKEEAGPGYYTCLRVREGEANGEIKVITRHGPEGDRARNALSSQLELFVPFRGQILAVPIHVRVEHQRPDCIRVMARNFPPMMARPGVGAALLACAGYTVLEKGVAMPAHDSSSVMVVSECCAEVKSASNVRSADPDLSLVLFRVVPPANDPYLQRLPTTFAADGYTVTVLIRSDPLSDPRHSRTRGNEAAEQMQPDSDASTARDEDIENEFVGPPVLDTTEVRPAAPIDSSWSDLGMLQQLQRNPLPQPQSASAGFYQDEHPASSSLPQADDLVMADPASTPEHQPAASSPGRQSLPLPVLQPPSDPGPSRHRATAPGLHLRSQLAQRSSAAESRPGSRLAASRPDSPPRPVRPLPAPSHTPLPPPPPPPQQQQQQQQQQQLPPPPLQQQRQQQQQQPSSTGRPPDAGLLDTFVAQSPEARAARLAEQSGAAKIVCLPARSSLQAATAAQPHQPTAAGSAASSPQLSAARPRRHSSGGSFERRNFFVMEEYTLERERQADSGRQQWLEPALRVAARQQTNPPDPQHAPLHDATIATIVETPGPSSSHTDLLMRDARTTSAGLGSVGVGGFASKSKLTIAGRPRVSIQLNAGTGTVEVHPASTSNPYPRRARRPPGERYDGTAALSVSMKAQMHQRALALTASRTSNRAISGGGHSQQRGGPAQQ